MTKAGGKENKDRKRIKYGVLSLNIEPSWQGIYVAYARHKERQAKNELENLLSEYVELMYPGADQIANDDEEEGQSVDIEDEIAQELNELKDTKKKNKKYSIMDTACECILFVRTRNPIDPVQLVHRICEDAQTSQVKKVRYCNKLTPISYTATANLEGVKRLAKHVLAPVFHKPEGQEPIKFAIKTNSRNHNTLKRDEIIKAVAETVGNEHGHSVDLKNYDKLILVECYKSSIGMSVVEDFERLKRFNLEQIYCSIINDSTETSSKPNDSRVAKREMELPKDFDDDASKKLRKVSDK